VPVVDFAAFGAVERRPLSRIQKIAGPRLHASWVNVPHVTQFDEADITDMEATRARLKDEAASRNIKLTPLAFVMRACVQALQAFPHFGASLDAEAGDLVVKKYVHVGIRGGHAERPRRSGGPRRRPQGRLRAWRANWRC